MIILAESLAELPGAIVMLDQLPASSQVQQCLSERAMRSVQLLDDSNSSLLPTYPMLTFSSLTCKAGGGEMNP